MVAVDLLDATDALDVTRLDEDFVGALVAEGFNPELMLLRFVGAVVAVPVFADPPVVVGVTAAVVLG